MLCPLCHSKQLTSSRVSALSNQQLSWQHRANICCRLWSTSAELMYFICTLLYTGTTLLYSYVYSSTAVLVCWCCLAVRRMLVYTRGQSTTSAALLYSCCTALHKSTWNRAPIRMIRTLCVAPVVLCTLEPRAGSLQAAIEYQQPVYPVYTTVSMCFYSYISGLDYIQSTYEYSLLLVIGDNEARPQYLQ